MFPKFPIFSLAALMVSAASAAPVEQTSPAAALTTAPVQMLVDPILGVSIQANDSFTEGGTYLTLPLWSTLGKGGTLGGSLLFFQPQFSAAEGGQVAGSFGFGFRHYFNHQTAADAAKVRDAGRRTEGFFLGGNLFVDTLRTSADNQLWQGGVGLEAGSRYVSLRGNYYIPFTERKRAGQLQYGYVSRSVFVDQTRYSEYRSESLNSVIETWGVYEEPMRGWDVELALLVPKLDRYTDVQLLLGYQDLDADSGAFGSEIRGWTAGVEWRPVPAVALSAMWHEDRRYRGEDWIFGARVEIPLGDRQALKDAFRFRRRHLQERLAEPVARQAPAIQVARTASIEAADGVFHYSRYHRFSAPPFFQFEDSIVYHDEFHYRFPLGQGIALDLMPPAGIVYWSSFFNFANGRSTFAVGTASSGSAAGAATAFSGGSGDTLNLVDWASAMTGSFLFSSNVAGGNLEFDLPSLTGGLSWDVSDINSNGTITTESEATNTTTP